MQALHRLLIEPSPRIMVDLVVVLVEDLDGGEVFGFTRRLRLRGFALLYRLRAGLHVGSRERWHERIGQLAHCQAPIGHCAVRVLCDDCLKGFRRFWVKEIVQKCDGAIEFALYCSTRDRGMDGPELIVGGLLGMSRSDHRSGCDCERKNPDLHGFLAPVRRAPLFPRQLGSISNLTSVKYAVQS